MFIDPRSFPYWHYEILSIKEYFKTKKKIKNTGWELFIVFPRDEIVVIRKAKELREIARKNSNAYLEKKKIEERDKKIKDPVKKRKPIELDEDDKWWDTKF